MTSCRSPGRGPRLPTPTASSVLHEAARGSYQSYGHASYDSYTYGYGGGEGDYDGGEVLEACSGDIIIHNHYHGSCGCDEPEYDGGATGGGDEESEYDPAPGEDTERGGAGNPVSRCTAARACTARAHACTM